MFDKFSKDFITIKDEQISFARLRNTSDWKILKEMIERYILKLTYNLVSGTETEKGVSEDELKYQRGFVRYWKKIVKTVELERNDDDEKPKTT